MFGLNKQVKFIYLWPDLTWMPRRALTVAIRDDSAEVLEASLRAASF